MGSDQGPPGGGGGQCGSGGWTCEHRWSTIMNMVKFANTVVGTGVENWQGGYNYLGFSRGNKGFVAMGDLGKNFYTGLPDGEYCDIITDCAQKIQISGGNGWRRTPTIPWWPSAWGANLTPNVLILIVNTIPVLCMYIVHMFASLKINFVYC